MGKKKATKQVHYKTIITNNTATINSNKSTFARPSHHSTSKNKYFKTTMATQGNNQCPWTIFYTNALNYMDSLHAETCQPQIKIAKFIVVVRHHFASPIMNLAKGKKPTKQSKMMIQNPNNSSKNNIQQQHR